MYNDQMLYKLAKARRDELIREARRHREIQPAEREGSSRIDLKVALAMGAPLLAVLLGVLII
jgi:hypothetical protein